MVTGYSLAAFGYCTAMVDIAGVSNQWWIRDRMKGRTFSHGGKKASREPAN